MLEERMLQTARRVQSRTPLTGSWGAARRITGPRFTNSLDVWPRLTFSGHADDASGGSTLAVRGAPGPQPRASHGPPAHGPALPSVAGVSDPPSLAGSKYSTDAAAGTNSQSEVPCEGGEDPAEAAVLW